MTKFKYLLFFLGILIPFLLIFKTLLMENTSVWGDAPYFFEESLRELVAEPLAWTQKGTVLGGVNNLLWLSPLMIKYGLLNKLFGFGNDEAIRLIFYFPAIIFSILSSFLFARSLGFSNIVRFFASLVYGLNTYFLLLVDGGQVGVALAYGLFPFTLLFLRTLVLKSTLNNFYLSLTALFVLGIADPRFSILSIFTIFLWHMFEILLGAARFEKRNLTAFTLLIVSYLALSMYWLYPLLSFKNNLGVEVSRLELTSLLNGLLLYQPHWPSNEFGVVSYPPFYFIGIPLLILIGLFFKSKGIGILILLYLSFAFLVKGATPPAGFIYDWFLKEVPFFQAFRDSTKFFTPLMLFAGVLIGYSVSYILEHLKKRRVAACAFVVLIWTYLLFLIHPVLLGNLNGVLRPRQVSSELLAVKELISRDTNFSRSVWFPEKHPFAFQSLNHPAVDAKDMVNLRPIATLNTGTLDKFNFLHQEESIDWMRILGIKYLVFSGEFRRKIDDEYLEDWEKLLNLVQSNPKLTKVENLPVFKVEETLPHLYSVSKLVAVAGGEDIYEKLKESDKNFDLSKQGTVFFEDGKFDPKSLLEVAPESAVIILNEKQEEDLALSFLQKYFLSPKKAQGGWAIRSDYLTWKYELLSQGVDTQEFDFAKGIAFSSHPQEKITFEISVPNDGRYVLAIRSMGKDEGDSLKANFNGEDFTIYHTSPKKFGWHIKNELRLNRGTQTLTLENPQGLAVINVVALVPKEAYDLAQSQSGQLTGRFKTLAIQDDSWPESPFEALNGSWKTISKEDAGTLRSRMTLPREVWLILTDSYHSDWHLNIGGNTFGALPIYSTVNGFYTGKGGVGTMYFKGQDYFRWGIWLSIISGFCLAVYYLWSKSSDKHN